jgi:hypothetical protein
MVQAAMMIPSNDEDWPQIQTKDHRMVVSSRQKVKRGFQTDTRIKLIPLQTAIHLQLYIPSPWYPAQAIQEQQLYYLNV